MRYTEFKLLSEQRLDEINMSPSSLRQLASGIDARVGIEFELVVPGYTSGEDSGEPDYSTNERIRDSDIGDVVAFFERSTGTNENSTSQLKKFENELREKCFEWQSERVADDWDNDGYDYLSEFIADYEGLSGDELDAAVEEAWGDRSSDHYTRAWDQYFEEHVNNHSENEWLDSEYNTYEDISREYDIYWPDVTYSDDNGEEYAASFSNAVGRTVTYNHEYHGADRNDTDYVAEPDSSIRGNAGESGIEFVSPPMSIADMIRDLARIPKWCARTGAYTNNSTGLHINVSVPGYSLERLDFVKLVLLMGDEYVLQQFGRLGNSYASSALNVVKQRAKTDKNAVNELMQQMKQHLNAAATKSLASAAGGKRFSANVKRDYVEFRSPGGNWLADSESGRVEQTILRFVVALDAALDETKYQTEYAKKLYKLLATNTGEDPTLEYFSRFASGIYSYDQLKNSMRSAQLGRSMQRDMAGGPTNKLYNWTAHVDAMPGIIDGIVARTEAEARSLARIELGVKSQFIRDNSIHVRAVSPAGVAEPDDPAKKLGMFEIVNLDTGRPVERFSAHGAADAQQQFDNYISHFGISAAEFELRQI